MSKFITEVVIEGKDATKPAVASATKGIESYGKAAAASNKKVQAASRGSRAAIQQVGYQAQDIAVQLQAGQSPFIVLSQQGSQVASIFGPAGAVAGAFIAISGIIAGNLLPALFKGSTDLKELEERAKSLGTTLKEIAPTAFAKQQRDLSKELEDVRKQMDAVNASTKEAEELAKRMDQGPTNSGNFLRLLNASDVEDTTISLEELLIKERELIDLLGKGTRVSAGEFEAAIEGMAAMSDRQNARLERSIQLQRSAETPLETYTRKTKELAAEIKDLGLSEAVHIANQKKLDDAYARTLTKKEKDVGTTNKQVDAYEALKLSLDSTYSATQSLDKSLDIISASTASVTEKTRMAGLAYAQWFDTTNKGVDEALPKQAKFLEQGSNGLVEYAEAAANAEQQMQSVTMNGINTMEDGLVGLINGTKTAADAFRDMASSIVNDLIRMQIQKSITGPLSGFLSGAMYENSSNFVGPPSPDSGWSFSNLFSASGGGYTGAGARSGGVDGKGGFPAILHPNETVVDHAQGQSLGGGVTVVQNINVSTGVQQTVRTEIAQLMPQIAAASKAAVLDARKRGGSYAAAFGG